MLPVFGTFEAIWTVLPKKIFWLRRCLWFLALSGTYWLVFGQRAEWMINSVSKEVKSAIAFCHLLASFNKVVCGLLGNWPCVLRNKQTGWRDWKEGQLWGLRLKMQMESQPWSLSCLSSSQPGSLELKAHLPRREPWHPSPRWAPWGTVPPKLYSTGDEGDRAVLQKQLGCFLGRRGGR